MQNVTISNFIISKFQISKFQKQNQHLNIKKIKIVKTHQHLKFIISKFQTSKFHNSKILRFENSKFQNCKIQKQQNSDLQIFELHGSASILEYQKNVKLRRKQFHMKDTGTSSSRKLRRTICYTLYRMDPQKTHYKISFSATFIKIQHFRKSGEKSVYIPPLTPDQPPFKGGYLCYIFMAS
jgi:hypothetical protein